MHYTAPTPGEARPAIQDLQHVLIAAPTVRQSLSKGVVATYKLKVSEWEARQHTKRADPCTSSRAAPHFTANDLRLYRLMKFVSERSQVTPAFIEQHIRPRLRCVGSRSGSVVGIGWDNHAIDFGTTIVRLPGDYDALRALRLEEQVCGRLSLPDLQIPRTQLVEGEYPFSWHRKIPGEHLLTDVYEALSERQKEAAAAKLARFLARVHAIPTESASTWGAPPLPWMPPEEIASLAGTIIPEDLQDNFGRAIDAYASLRIADADRVFGHFDAHGWNMAFDRAAGELTGIFDFGDCAIGDRHVDFHPLNTISRDLSRRVISHYEELTGCTIDRGRVQLYTVVAEYSELSGAMKQGLDTEHHLGQLRRWQRELEI